MYVYDDVEWPPYVTEAETALPSSSLLARGGILSIQLEKVQELPSRLRAIRDDDYNEMRRHLARVRVGHFSYEGVLEQIKRFMVGGTGLSDLRCRQLPLTEK